MSVPVALMLVLMLAGIVIIALDYLTDDDDL